ncbi:MAG TPA: SpoIIE family protein phosphatase [Rectinemataceae bacterium]|nr:SpoIIE family protein phosphatase [Rectinemataceae bacterium]
MRPNKRFVSPLRIGAALALLLVCLTARDSGALDYWEPPSVLASGRFPTVFATREGPLVLWQQSQVSGETGKAWIWRAYLRDGAWRSDRIDEQPLAFQGAEPLLYSASMSTSGEIAVAWPSSSRSFEVSLSDDGGKTFRRSGSIDSASTSVAPRIFPSAKGGWILFVTQGKPGAALGQDQGSLPSTISIYSSVSSDGGSWSTLQPLVAPDEGLSVNFLPASAPVGGRDVVVFQTLIPLEGSVPSHYMLMAKTSADGGRSWSRAALVTGFADPAGGESAGSENYDNQRPVLFPIDGSALLVWERRMTKTTRTQIWSARLDGGGALESGSLAPVSPDVGSYILSQTYESDGRPMVVYLEDRLKGNAVYDAHYREGRWESESLGLSAKSDPAQSGFTAFARVIMFKGRSYVAWQYDKSGSSRIYTLEPVLHVDPPSLAALNFDPARKSRHESAQIRVDFPVDVSGIKRFAYLWSRGARSAGATLAEQGAGAAQRQDAALIWRTGTVVPASEQSLELPAAQDGSWTLAVSIEDNAGNRSRPASLTFVRKRTPPRPPIILPPDTDPGGFLASNTFTIDWQEAPDPDLAGYTWELRYAGPLEGKAAPGALSQRTGGPAVAAAQLTAAKGAAAKGAAARPAPLPGLSPYESQLVQLAGPPVPPPVIRGTTPGFSQTNVDDGYYLFSVAAIDSVGNISDVSTILLRADKYVPHTIVTRVEPTQDALGRTSLRILGRGFTTGGIIDRIALDRDGQSPYDVERSAGDGDYRLASDREIDGFSFGDVQTGQYRLGLHHTARGWYWTPALVSVDLSGTVKYGVEAAYHPAWRFLGLRSRPLSIYDAFILAAILFAGLGLALSLRQVVLVAREGAEVRQEVLALISGGSMPTTEKLRRAQTLKRRGAGLRVKFTLTIGILVIFVVVLVSIPLGLLMINTQRSALATGLEQRAKVLLESAAQGGRFFLGKEDAVTQLSFLPDQAKAMEGGVYITITGNSAQAKVAGQDVVYATNDDAIASKVEGAPFVLGQSVMRSSGPGADPLAPGIASMAAELQTKSEEAIAQNLADKVRLSQEKAGLGQGAAASARRSQINDALDQEDRRIRETLRSISDAAVGSMPRFDPAKPASRPEDFLFYKPIIEYRPNDQLLYRGMVRLEVSTVHIVAELRSATASLVRITLIIAAIALGIGILGAFILSTAIVRPIRKLVLQIAKIRDTPDIETLAGERIEVATHDELFTLADTVNQMTDGLVKAAKASKELIVGKGIQKMFIPLDPAPGSRAKLSTGSRDEKDFEVFGYYEGAKGVSGDYWDFKSINARYHYFIKCDISGKGVSAALIMVQVATMVINYFNEWKKAMPRNIDLTELAYQINDFIEERGFQGRFAAFTLGLWDSQGGTAYICEAGDRKLHFWDHRRGELVEELLPDSPAAGIFPSFMVQMKNPMVQIVRKFEKDDVLLLYTDGIEEAKRHFRDADFKIVPCTDVPKDQEHGNHSGGQDNEEFGYDRITSILTAVDRRGSYRLVKQHDPLSDDVLSFDFSTCSGSLEEQVLALIAVEKVFRMYPDPQATESDYVLVDEKVDKFLERHFDQYRLYCSKKKPYADPQKDNPGYLLYAGIKEDDQYDDLTILGIRRK